MLACYIEYNYAAASVGHANDLANISLVTLPGHGTVVSKRVRTVMSELNNDFPDGVLASSLAEGVLRLAPLRHHCVIVFIGVAWRTVHDVQMLMEYMDQGDFWHIPSSHAAKR